MKSGQVRAPLAPLVALLLAVQGLFGLLTPMPRVSAGALEICTGQGPLRLAADPDEDLPNDPASNCALCLVPVAGAPPAPVGAPEPLPRAREPVRPQAPVPYPDHRVVASWPRAPPVG